VKSDGRFSEAHTGTVAIFCATRDGQSERIAERIAERLSDCGASTAFCLLRRGAEPAIDKRSSAVVAILPVRYGWMLPEAARFLRVYAARTNAPPLALAVVNLVARNKARRGPETNPYLRGTLKRFRLRPALATAIAGRLNYPKYRFVDKQAIRLIMAMTGGVADGRSDIEYTDWAQVDGFAADIVALARRPRGAPEESGVCCEG
jgi:menaquinone-dependent protoporphyrinogen oxidase